MAKSFEQVYRDALGLSESDQQALCTVLSINNESGGKRSTRSSGGSKKKTASKGAKRKPRGQVLEAVKKALGKTPQKPSGIVAKTGLKSQQINNVLQKLKADKFAKKTTKGWVKA